MFYSQFILAKKGPLGTIWIAAHLERKLRKNQVADTDIGVSVDSILFPEVPIALRLSSHLLLGVVRIYSRKVNYLFDDCSEALLKIKQAFRSTAVDLPPEESTAPYHSITLPETFDLDDFELPDNDIFQGNYVDHHVSTREQITLQDTMDGVVYSTSQFGLDERFGDGETSHVGLDLEEDLFLDKVAAPELNEVSEASLQLAVEPFTPKVEENDDMVGAAEATPVNGTTNKMGGKASDSESFEYAQAPSTPGLVEEANLFSIEDGLACDDHLEPEDCNLTKLAQIESTGNASDNQYPHMDDTMDLSTGTNLNHETAEENGCLSGDLEFNQAKLQGDLPSTVLAMDCLQAEGSDRVKETNNAVFSGDTSAPSVDRMNWECRESVEGRSDIVIITNDMEDSSSLGKAVDSTSGCPSGAPETDVRVCEGPEDPDTLNNLVGNDKARTRRGVLRSCNHLNECDGSSHAINNDELPPEAEDSMPRSLETSRSEEPLLVPGTSTEVQGEECHVSDGIQSMENQIPEPNFNGQSQPDGGKSEEQLDNAISSATRFEYLNCSLSSDLPMPEKLLSVPQELNDKPNDLLVGSTPDKEIVDGGDRSSAGTNITGKKRSFTESSLTVQSLYSVDSFGATKSKRTVDLIPDDDDLLSSILVGRSSFLKMKPTPPGPEATSMKRVRSASRPSATKRKLLMDDSMVLLGDTIRQQLTNTEDIRRLRKKAPCTRTEILMIQRKFLDEEIFREPVLTGMSGELTCLHSETFDLSRINISGNDNNNTSEVAKGSTTPTVAQDNKMEASTEPVICGNDDGGKPVESPIRTENQQSEDPRLVSSFLNEVKMNAVVDVTNYRSLEHETLGEIVEMEIDRGNAQVADAANHAAVLHFEASYTEPVSGDTGNLLDGASLMDGTICADASLQMDTSVLAPDKMDTQLSEDVALRDVGDGKTLDDIEVLDHHAENIVASGTELRVGEEILMEENKVGLSVEVGLDFHVDGSAPADDADTLLANISSEKGLCTDITSVHVDQTQDDVENDKLGGCNEDGGFTLSSGRGDKEQNFNHLCSEESKMDSSFSIVSDKDLTNASLNDEDYLVCQDADQLRTANAEITSVDYPVVSDLQDVAFANDTEFLNADDDDVVEDDDGMPAPDDARLLDNSGWSSRTRAVAKYLQTIFDNEGGNGSKVISVDSLLAGKTRKEASRMFFETLVLKTRDYIHVEQWKPFDIINVKPRAKLMKSEF